MMDNERLTAFFKPHHDPSRPHPAPSCYDPIASQAKILSSALSAHIVAGLHASLPSTSIAPQIPTHYGPPTMVMPPQMQHLHQHVPSSQPQISQSQPGGGVPANPQQPHVPVTSAQQPQPSEVHPPPPPGPPHELDIALYSDRDRLLSRDEIYRVLTNAWSPPQEFTFPNSTRYTPSRGLRVLRFHRHWLQAYPFLAYSASKLGVYCRYCVLFGTRKVGGTPLGAFVTKPFKTYRKFHEKSRKHSTRKYHIEATRRAVEYKMRYEAREDVSDLVPSPNIVWPQAPPQPQPPTSQAGNNGTGQQQRTG